MEKHRCKLCFKTFSNGKALGGHMRSHLLNLPVENNPFDETDQSTPSASFSDDNHLGFVGSVVLQDRESETESSKNPTRRRSKRIRKSSSRLLNPNPSHEAKKKGRFVKVSSESWPEPEPVSSSISDVTTEEDVAFCLMMMSRDDTWKHGRENVKLLYAEEEVDDEDEDEEEDLEENDDDDDDEETDESDGLEYISKMNNKSRGKYRCETCSRTFRSYQALGGHRASHRKSQAGPLLEAAVVAEAPAVKADPKVHECPYCFRVFTSGQALGGHKRSHAANYASTSVPEGKRVIPANPNSSMIDLNLPATVEDDESGQAELSALSDAEFVLDPYRHVRQLR